MNTTRTNFQVACDGVRLAWRPASVLPHVSHGIQRVRSVDGITIVRRTASADRLTHQTPSQWMHAHTVRTLERIGSSMDGVALPTFGRTRTS